MMAVTYISNKADAHFDNEIEMAQFDASLLVSKEISKIDIYGIQ